MRLLLTSAGISNPSIHDALVDLLGKPITESNALFVPTAMYGLTGGAAMAWRSICGLASTPFCELGWKSMGVLELTALPTIKKEHWVPMVQETDALLVGRRLPVSQLLDAAVRASGSFAVAMREDGLCGVERR
jgi:dipeptidase E